MMPMSQVEQAQKVFADKSTAFVVKVYPSVSSNSAISYHLVAYFRARRLYMDSLFAEIKKIRRRKNTRSLE